MAELVDAPDSKSGFRKKVKVRFLSWAQRRILKWLIISHFLLIPINNLRFLRIVAHLLTNFWHSLYLWRFDSFYWALQLMHLKAFKTPNYLAVKNLVCGCKRQKLSILAKRTNGKRSLDWTFLVAKIKLYSLQPLPGILAACYSPKIINGHLPCFMRKILLSMRGYVSIKWKESENWKSQIVISNSEKIGLRKRSFAIARRVCYLWFGKQIIFTFCILINWPLSLPG